MFGERQAFRRIQTVDFLAVVFQGAVVRPQQHTIASVVWYYPVLGNGLGVHWRALER